MRQELDLNSNEKINPLEDINFRISSFINTFTSILYVAIVMAIGGIVLIAVAYALIRYLKIPRHGYIYEVLHPAEERAQLQVESLIIAETFASQPAAESGTQYGGGSFGGGGAGSKF